MCTKSKTVSQSSKSANKQAHVILAFEPRVRRVPSNIDLKIPAAVDNKDLPACTMAPECRAVGPSSWEWSRAPPAWRCWGRWCCGRGATKRLQLQSRPRASADAAGGRPRARRRCPTTWAPATTQGRTRATRHTRGATSSGRGNRPRGLPPAAKGRGRGGASGDADRQLTTR